jgi:hypothetical protein
MISILKDKKNLKNGVSMKLSIRPAVHPARRHLPMRIPVAFSIIPAEKTICGGRPACLSLIFGVHRHGEEMTAKQSWGLG